jgi:hypothetical protein
VSNYYDPDRKESTQRIIQQIARGELLVGEQVGVVDAAGSEDIVAHDYILYHVSADDTIVVLRNGAGASELYRFDDEDGHSNDGRKLILTEAIFQLAVRDKINLKGKYREDLIGARRRGYVGPDLSGIIG